jgi:Repeat of unknown function (DUF5907)
VATLGSDAKIPTSQLPALAITDTFVVASQAAMLALTAEVGDVAVRTDLNKSLILRAAGASTLGNWQELLTPTDAVTSVNGQTGAVSLTASGLGALAAANNLSDVANAATARTNLGLAIGTNVQAYSAEVAALAALSPSNDDVIQRKAGAWATRSMAQLKADLAVSKSDVGLGSVDNTSDVSKPVSTATQSALDLKASLASPALMGTPTAPTASAGTSTTQIATTAFVAGEIAGGATPDATTLVKGKVQLAGDLGGTAASPTVPGLSTKQPLDATLTALAAHNSNGLLVQTAADTFAARSIAESYNLPAAAVACGPSGRPRAARCTRPRLSGYGLPRGRFPGRLGRFGWGRLAVGARGVVGGVRRPTVWGRCYRRPEVAAVSTDAGCAQAIVRPGEDCRRLKQCLMTLGIHGIFQC